MSRECVDNLLGKFDTYGDEFTLCGGKYLMYHFTDSDKLDGIFERGLCDEFGDSEGVYMFTSETAAKVALGGWLWDHVKDYSNLSLVYVGVPENCFYENVIPFGDDVHVVRYGDVIKSDWLAAVVEI